MVQVVELRCKRCGAPLTIKDEAKLQMVHCEYCGSTYFLEFRDIKPPKKVSNKIYVGVENVMIKNKRFPFPYSKRAIRDTIKMSIKGV